MDVAPRSRSRPFRTGRSPCCGLGGRHNPRGRAGGGERIPPVGPIGARVVSGLASLAGLAGVVAYAAASSAKYPGLCAAVGACGVAIALVALAGRWASLLPVGVTGVGAAYAVSLSFRSGTVDSRAPFVAAGLFLAVECAYWSLGPSAGRPDRRTVARRLLLGCASAVAAALVGALVLVAANDSTRGVGFEAMGVAAALTILLVVAAISSRTKIRS